MILILKRKTEVLCSEKLCQKSELLHQLDVFTDGDRSPVQLPEFASSECIKFIMNILEAEDFGELCHSELDFLLDTLKLSDFLGVHEFTMKLLSVIKDKVTHPNCFYIFRLINMTVCFKDITDHCLSVMMRCLNHYYDKNAFSEHIPDPYTKNYVVMSLYEIEMMLTHSSDTTTMTKILIFKNWWIHNKRSHSRNEVLGFLEFLNEDASYTPRNHIIFMRSIRDKIIAELNHLQKHNYWGKKVFYFIICVKLWKLTFQSIKYHNVPVPKQQHSS